MRFLGLAVVASAAIVLGACGGDKAAETPATDTTAMAAPAPEMAAPGAAGAMSPITGTIHEVNMVGDEKGYRYEPAELTIKAGDGIKFNMISGGPHNVAFDPTTLPADVKSQLMANMLNQSMELSSPMMVTAGESYTISFGGVAPGVYDFHCTPHLAMNMKGKITVQ